MTASSDELQRTVRELRRAFDESFQRPFEISTAPEEELLALSAGGSLLAVRARETGGVLRCPRITPVPSSYPPLAGICAVRGSLVAAYSIAGLLGDPAAPGGEWMLLASGDRSMGFVFDELRSWLRVRSGDIRPAADRGVGRGREQVRIEGRSRAVLRIPALVERIRLASATGETAVLEE